MSTIPRGVSNPIVRRQKSLLESQIAEVDSAMRIFARPSCILLEADWNQVQLETGLIAPRENEGELRVQVEEEEEAFDEDRAQASNFSENQEDWVHVFNERGSDLVESLENLKV